MRRAAIVAVFLAIIAVLVLFGGDPKPEPRVTPITVAPAQPRSIP